MTKKTRRNVDEPRRVVLVGTYRGGQLKDWPGWYCWPLDDDVSAAKSAKKFSRGDAEMRSVKDPSRVSRPVSGFSSVTELWLYKGTADERRYRAEFVGVKTREELFRDYGYPGGDDSATKNAKDAKRKGRALSRPSKPHGTHYALFKTELRYRHKNDLPGEADAVIVRLKDFARTPKVRKQLREYLESPNRNDPDLAKLLPSIVTSVPPERLRVCEGAVQMSFVRSLFPETVMTYAKPRLGNYRIASLFAGCGGLDLGFIGGFDFLGKQFDRNKFDVVWANELNPNACKTYERNLGPHIVCGDIKEKLDEIPSDIDVIMGGFPCQDISINGKMLGIKGKRSSLYSYIVEAVRRCRPKVFLAENVGSLMLKQNEYSFKTILSDFEALDYNVTYKVYHAEEYGVPQTRERIIFVGTRKDLPVFAPPEPLADMPITCGDALRDLENRPADKEFSHTWSVAAPSGEQGSRKMVEDRPGYTIRAECHGNIQFHYKLPRRLSMREAARIQSFPDSFVFPCGIRETERQIGNAVPPVLAWHIARKVEKILEEAK